MPDIFQDFPIRSTVADVFAAISTPAGLNEWWTNSCAGQCAVGQVYEFWFSPEYDWRGVVTKYVPNQEIEWRMTQSDNDWNGTLVGFVLEPKSDSVWVRFHHTGWPRDNEHFRISNHCWAMYLRVLRRYLEHGERVPYEKRLDV